MYQPEISEENIKNLYHLKLTTKKPMTKLINAILTAFFHQLEEVEKTGTSAVSSDGDGQVLVGSIQLNLQNTDKNGGGAGESGKRSPKRRCKAETKGVPY